MKVFEGVSRAADADAAVAEALSGWPAGARPDVVFAFVSTVQDTRRVAKLLAERFPSIPVVGCTSAGEQMTGVHYTGALIVAGLEDSGIRWAAAPIHGISEMTEQKARAAADSLFEALGVERELFDPGECFCIQLVDGMSRREEIVSAMVAEAIEGVAVGGGSAGDDLAFKETRLFLNGETFTDGALLVMGRGKGRFEMMKHQHFVRTPRRLVITRVDTAERRVYEINGLPAKEAYARALGVTQDHIDDDLIFRNPVTFTCEGDSYVRSVQQILPDGSILFYCGVELGMVLEVGGHRDMFSSLSEDLERLNARRGKAAFLLTWNCVQRAHETRVQGTTEAVFGLLPSAGRSTMGFDTYGEQLNGIHINQTLVVLALHDAAA